MNVLRFISVQTLPCVLKQATNHCKISSAVTSETSAEAISYFRYFRVCLFPMNHPLQRPTQRAIRAATTKVAAINTPDQTKRQNNGPRSAFDSISSTDNVASGLNMGLPIHRSTPQGLRRSLHPDCERKPDLPVRHYSAGNKKGICPPRVRAEPPRAKHRRNDCDRCQQESKQRECRPEPHLSDGLSPAGRRLPESSSHFHRIPSFSQTVHRMHEAHRTPPSRQSVEATGWSGRHRPVS